MKSFLALIMLFTLSISCSNTNYLSEIKKYNTIEFLPMYEDEEFSTRAIEIDKTGMLVYAGNNGQYGFIDSKTGIQKHEQLIDEKAKTMEFRGISPSNIGVNFISAGSPALLYKISYSNWTPKLVYNDQAEDVFFDAMAFWNDEEGIAFGDAVDGCMSVLITRDGGTTWKKLDCEKFFPEKGEHEGAFAASNTNISIVGDHAWLASGTRIFHTADKGMTWEVSETPIIQEKETQGIYSIDFYDEKNGIAIGGDYTEADNNTNNLIKTTDGGKTWKVISSESSPGYRSCIQYIPNSKGKGLLAVGFKGIDLSKDGGKTWSKLSEEGYYTVRFSDEKSGFLAGRGRITKFELN